MSLGNRTGERGLGAEHGHRGPLPAMEGRSYFTQVRGISIVV